jgi:hypothetical protein
MKKLFLLYIAGILLISLFLHSSCKKVTHPLYATPGNYRVQSYTKISYNASGATVNSNYTFYYDGSGRVSKILFTSNDSSAGTEGKEYTSSTFSYFSDSIIKTTTEVNTAVVLETDTFVTNPQGLIAYVYMPDYVASFQYLGKLLTIETEEYKGDSGTSISASAMNYTSSNSDLLLRTFSGSLSLTASWGDTGRNAALNPPDVQFVPPFTVQWISYTGTTPAIVTHSGVTGFSDVLNGYNTGGPIEVTITDANGAINRDTCIFPQDLALAQAYSVYTALPNRSGDYLQLESFTKYGANIYQNAHLISKIANPNDTISVHYVIDADSKITQTVVNTKYALSSIPSSNFTASVVYDIQYETY